MFSWNSLHWSSTQLIRMEQTASARLGTTALPLNNSSVINKFDELLNSLYPSEPRVLSSHISVGIK